MMELTKLLFFNSLRKKLFRKCFLVKFRRKNFTCLSAYKGNMRKSNLKWPLWNCHQLKTITQIYFLVIFVAIFFGTPSVMAGCRKDDTKPCESICSMDSESVHTCVIRALVLLPLNDFYEASLTKVVPVLKIAEDRIRATQLLPSNVSFSWIAKDDKCDAAYATIKAMDGITKNCSHVIFGPACDYPLAAVGRITQYFHAEGTPLISVGGSTIDFQKKKTACQDEFYMLIRLGVISFQSIAQLTIAVLKKYNWNKVVLLHERDGQKNVAGQHTCFLMMQSLAKILRDEDIALSAYLLESGNQNFTDDLRNEVGNHHSIVIMCADPHSIRQIMLAAEELNMIASGEYVFINIELFSKIPHVISEPWKDANDSKINNERAKRAYEAMLTVTPKQPDDEEYIRISDEIKHIASEKYNYSFPRNEPLSTFVTSFYDGVLLYASALNESIREDSDVLNKPINGTDILRRMWNRTFKGITGNVTIDSNGDRVSAYSLLDLNPESGKFEIVAHFLHNRLEYVKGKSIHWAGNRLEPPLDMPICGFDGSLCPDNSLPGYAILSIILGFIVIVMSIGSFIGYRHYKSEAEINSMAWKVSFDDVIIHESVYKCFRGSMHSLIKSKSQVTLLSEDLGSFGGDRQIFIPVGFYKGCKVAIKQIDESSINLNRSLMLELKRMKDIQHDHLVKFFGACLDPPKCFLLTEYCPKGSLQDILENEQIELDWMFKLSLMHDIVRGMHFLHNSDIKSHGNLKSSNCVVDSRFVLKITDFGLNSLKKGNIEDDIENCNSYAYWKKMLWTAPELLKMENRPLDGTPKGDVYSFGIIVHEITTRQGPFYLGCGDELSPEEIVQLVKSFDLTSSLNSRPFRPRIVETTSEEICNLMIRCWAEDPLERPDFHSLKTTIRKINKDNETGNIVDNLLKRMEQYANNLEGLVEERTQDYLEEKKKYEKLLYQLLPQTVAAQLISGQPVVAETFDQVTIYFSDIVGFTAISAESTPMEVVKFLNDLYTCFDSIVENYDVYKVETIGDAYMVVSGLPVRNGNLHAREIARLALALLNAVYSFKIHHRPNDQLKLRIGLHSGPCVAGVVGLKMPRYCLFGDTVNTASRMESNGEALRIHISETTKQYLDHFGSFITKERGYVQMKGKGEQLTYWLEGENLPSDSFTKHSQLTTMSNCHTPPSYSHHIRQSLRLNQRNSSSSPKLNGDSKTDEMQRFNSFIGVPPPLRQTHDDEHLVDLKNFLTNQNSLNDRTNDTQLILSSAPATAAINGNNSKIAHKNFCPHSHGNKVYCNCTTSCSTNNLSRSNNSLNFNNIIKTNNLKNNFKTICNHSSNASEDANNVKCVTQPLLGKISS